MSKRICCRCYEEVDKLYPSNCDEKPDERIGVYLSQYYCPSCNALVVSGIQHPELCKRCSERIHPNIDTVIKGD